MKKIFIIAAMALMTLSASAQKIGRVNFSELVQLMPDADKARETIQASSAEAQETYQSMLDEFNAKYSTYNQKAGTWTQAIRESKEKELTEIQQRIQEFGQSVQAELQQQEQSLMAPIYQKAREVVNDLAKKGGYIYVFDVNSILYIDAKQSVDLTPEARKVMGIPAGRTLESLQAELQAQAQTMQQ